MPKRQNYDLDGGFIEAAPRDKKRKGEAGTATKEDNAILSTTMQKDDEGNSFWEITNNKRVVISTFKNIKMVSIREYYEKDGRSLPGKKGISLPVDQFSTIIELLPAIEDIFGNQGVKLPRPRYDAKGKSTVAEEVAKQEQGMDAEESEEDTGIVSKQDRMAARGKLDNFKMKKNHEATDDEDD
ncbi:Hypothetical protein R9X50_00331100 [Acrodontium crateriforme]|uniref:Transcriptional coactivator p15 (PC4) C-terminal domain-containing protein n=1 Tax=Acrodontium crateriforme TaxID=150365 RepID=A0AAQ3M8T0_9PEZI|nr:Hypothetical protein R9X50_00331100 [Acrodontium crateriforme]